MIFNVEENNQTIVNFEKSLTGPVSNQLEYNIRRTLMIGDSFTNDYIPFINCFTSKSANVNNQRLLIYEFFYNDNTFQPNYIGRDSSRRRRTRRVRNPETGRLEGSARSLALSQQEDPDELMFKIKKINYADVLYSLDTYIIPRIFETEKVMFQAGKGIIFDFDYETKETMILLTLAIRSDYIGQCKQDFEQNKIDKSKFVIYVTNYFRDADEYKDLFKKVKKEYLAKAEEEGIDIIYTNIIESRLYKTSYVKPKFKTIVEMNTFLQTLNDNLYE